MTYSTFDKFKGMWQMIRPVNDAVMGTGLIVGMILAGSYEMGIPFIFYVYTFFAGFFVSAHAMVINDIIDIEIDKINEPDRVLPQQIITIRTAWIWGILLAILGLLFFILIDIGKYDKVPYLWVYGLAHVLLADLYNYKLKETGFLGNLTVAWTAYALFLGADFFLNGKLTLIPQVLGVMAFCANLSREIYKGIIDQEGDKIHGIRTIAVVLGPQKAKLIATGILIICPLVAIYAFPQLYLIGKIGMVVVFILFLYIIVLAKDAEFPSQSRKIKTYILLTPLLAAPFLILDQIFKIQFIA